MDIATHNQLEQILTKAAKDADEKVLEARSGSEERQGKKYKLCTLKFERYRAEVQHIQMTGQEDYVSFHMFYTNNFDSSMGQTELYYLAQMLRKKKVCMPPLFPNQVIFQTEPAEEKVYNKFYEYIISERKVYQAKIEYLEKLANFVDQTKKEN